MIWVAILFFVLCLGVWVVSYFFTEEGKVLAKIISGLLLVFSTVSLVLASLTIVGPGDMGVQVLFGKVYNEPIESGIHFVNPFTNIHKLSVRTETYIMSHVHDEGQKKGDDSIGVLSSDRLQMQMEITVPYRLNPSAATWVYKNLGTKYVENIVRPAVRTAVRRAGAKFTAEDCCSIKRDELAEQMKTFTEEEVTRLLKEGYQDAPEKVMLVSQILIGEVKLPDKLKAAIEDKLKADQEAQAMTFVLKKAEQEKERRRIEGEGIQKFQEIVTKGVNETYLRWKGIEATEKLAESHNAKIIIIGGGKDGLPIILGGVTGTAPDK